MSALFVNVDRDLKDSGIDYSVLNSTAWGYSIHAYKQSAVTRINVFETLLLCLGGALVFGVAGLWGAPGLALSGAVVVIKLGLTGALILAAVSLFELSRRGLRREFHIDTSRKEVRSVWRNRKDQMHLDAVIAFDEVASIFVHARKLPTDVATLHIRYGTFGETIEVASGNELEMRALWEKLNIDLLRAMPDRVPSSKPRPIRFRRRNAPSVLGDEFAAGRSSAVRSPVGFLR